MESIRNSRTNKSRRPNNRSEQIHQLETTSEYQSHVRKCVQNSGAKNNNKNPSNSVQIQMSHDP